MCVSERASTSASGYSTSIAPGRHEEHAYLHTAQAIRLSRRADAEQRTSWGGGASHRSVGLRLPAAASAKHTGPLQRMVSRQFHGWEYGKSTEAEVSAQTVQEQPGIKMHSPARQRPPLLQQILCALPFRVLLLLVCGNIQIKLRDKNINASTRFNCRRKNVSGHISIDRSAGTTPAIIFAAAAMAMIPWPAARVICLRCVCK